MHINDKRILVVGGAGYIGSHMVLLLRRAGFVPVVLDNFSTGHRDALPPDVLLIEGDVTNLDILHRIFSEQAFLAVMHFASLIEVGDSMRNPLRYYQNNVNGALNLLTAMIDHGIKRLIFSSSAAVYGEPKATLIDESHPVAPINPYGRSKQMVEDMIRDLGNGHGLQYAILRYFNAAGADPDGLVGERHQPESHLIPLLLDVAAGKRKNITVFGMNHETPDGSCVRDYVHVVDICQAHLLALEALLGGKKAITYNLGTGQGHSVLEVIRSVERVTGKMIQKVIGSGRKGDPAVLVADAGLAKKELGWQPQYHHLDMVVEHAWQYKIQKNQKLISVRYQSEVIAGK